MLRRALSSRLFLLAALAPLAACSSSAADAPAGEDVGAFQGTVSSLAELTFETEVRAPTAAQAERYLDAQLYWLVGPFHELGGDPRLTWAKSEKLGTTTETAPRAEAVARFRVSIEVAWPKETRLPESYDLVLPRRIDPEAQQAFFAKYKEKCIDAGDHDTDWSNAWYEFKPGWDGCALEDADVVRPRAAVRLKQANTVGTYPEYDRIWADKKLQVVAVYGRDTPGSTSESDLGAKEYAKHVKAVKALPGLADVRATDSTFQDGGREEKQSIVEANLAGGRKVRFVTFLLSKPSWSGRPFEERYEPETEEADYVAYAGHAGLGGNIQKLQSLGRFKAGQYQLFAFDGCDTFAYIDRTLFQKKTAANGADDPAGTRDMDVLLNALPAPWTSGDPSILKVARALLDDAHPKPFEKILKMFPEESAPVVVGDEDNRFAPR